MHLVAKARGSWTTCNDSSGASLKFLPSANIALFPKRSRSVQEIAHMSAFKMRKGGYRRDNGRVLALLRFSLVQTQSGTIGRRCRPSLRRTLRPVVGKAFLRQGRQRDACTSHSVALADTAGVDNSQSHQKGIGTSSSSAGDDDKSVADPFGPVDTQHFKNNRIPTTLAPIDLAG
ncbi:hypothetical protein BDZ89DRAFT_1046523 [Hymenopellis radicata]|nr:hypothetical protein BDZ89DRAFT_1046523 [Hymenopellis radicata]